MPALSKAQQRLMAVAEKEPAKVSKKNRGVLAMSRRDLHDFADTPTKGLPGKMRAAAERGKC